MKILFSDKDKLFITLLSIILLLFPNVFSGCKKVQRQRGCIEGNCENGHGTFIYPDNAKYKGQFKDGKWHGSGTFNLGAIEVHGKDVINDDYILGIDKRYKHGLLFHHHHLSGRLYREGGKPMEYIGEFKNGVFDGHGTITFPNFDKYKGQFKNGLPDGQGTYIFHGGKKYVGKMKKGAIKGKGIMTYPDGKKYIGLFKERQVFALKYATEEDLGDYLFDRCCHPNGQGIMISPDGTKQKGMFIDGEYVNLPSNKTKLTTKSKPKEIAEKNKRGIIEKLENFCTKNITSLGYSIDKIKFVDVIDINDELFVFCLLYKSGDFTGAYFWSPKANRYVIYNTTENMESYNQLMKMLPDKKKHFIRSEFIKYAKYEFPK